MSNVFKNVSGTATTSGLTVYTVPSATTAVVIGLMLCNKSAAQITATVTIGSINVLYQVPIPANSSFSGLDGKLIMTAGQSMTVTASALSSIDCFVSLLEQA